ncbi:DUF1801 domain-containing protein [Flavihumibacter sp. CACIAM 22H1]|uniref:DUF1801 domain-containing protein n=1 Tax=Flavihumibacter sp. CACIAM 22H1 TaxID=1812911 RepID=UPI0025B81620|nr:DUF1801 domain-containing protein [Flavihumibacter sp. CACIAM 22H1]
MKPTDLNTYLEELTHPLKEEIMEVRQIILNSNKQLTEHIKWNAPSYCFKGEDRITFNLHGTKFFRLIFHCGVKIKARKIKGKMVSDKDQLLNWVADDRAVLQFSDMIEVMQKKKAIGLLVNEWIKHTT